MKCGEAQANFTRLLYKWKSMHFKVEITNNFGEILACTSSEICSDQQHITNQYILLIKSHIFMTI